MKFASNSILRLCLLVFVTTIFLAGCGGGGGGGGTTTALQGVFLDGAVEGLTYSSGSQSGITDANGTFSYEQGATITFMVGDIVVGTANAQPIMTPVSLVSGAVDETNPTVMNMVQFFMTIDDDNNPANGIQITASVDAAAIGQSLDFTLNSIDFGTDINSLNVITILTSATTSGPSALVSEQAAQSHLSNTLLSTFAGIYNGTFSGDDSGTWTIVVDTNGTVSGSGCSTTQQDEFIIGGTVASSGTSALGFASDGSYAGNFSSTGGFSGTWSADGGASTGNFIGSKANSSSGGTCSGGSLPPSNGNGGGSNDSALLGTWHLSTVNGQAILPGTFLIWEYTENTIIISHDLDCNQVVSYTTSGGKVFGTIIDQSGTQCGDQVGDSLGSFDYTVNGTTLTTVSEFDASMNPPVATFVFIKG